MFRNHPVRSALLVFAHSLVFAGVTWVIWRYLGSPFQPQFGEWGGSGQFVEAVWWIVGGRLLIEVTRLLVMRKSRPYETRIVSDLLAAAVYVATGFAVISFAFDLPIGGLLATSGVIAIVLGLALQSTLADVFSGIAVGIERPYKPGDFLWVEGGVEGTVVQINWRSTQISTGHSNIAIIPNSIIAKSRLENRSSPTLVRGDTVGVDLDANADPRRCLEALTAALRACRLPLIEPAASVVCSGLHGDGNRYEIWYWVESSKDLAVARTELFTQIHRHLRHAGIALAIAGIVAPAPCPPPSIAELLAQSAMFGVLTPDERKILAEYFVGTTFERGDTLVREGDMPDAMFLLSSGTVEVFREQADGTRQFLRFGPGESFGIIALIMGTPSLGTAAALTAVAAYRLDKAGIAAVMKARPEMAVGLEALARRAQDVLLREMGAQEHTPLKQPEMFLARLRQFLQHLRG